MFALHHFDKAVIFNCLKYIEQACSVRIIEGKLVEFLFLKVYQLAM